MTQDCSKLYLWWEIFVNNNVEGFYFGISLFPRLDLTKKMKEHRSIYIKPCCFILVWKFRSLCTCEGWEALILYRENKYWALWSLCNADSNEFSSFLLIMHILIWLEEVASYDHQGLYFALLSWQLIACGVAVATYNEGATDFKETPAYKESIQSRELLEEPDASTSDVFESNPTEVAPSLE